MEDMRDFLLLRDEEEEVPLKEEKDVSWQGDDSASSSSEAPSTAPQEGAPTASPTPSGGTTGKWNYKTKLPPRPSKSRDPSAKFRCATYPTPGPPHPLSGVAPGCDSSFTRKHSLKVHAEKFHKDVMHIFHSTLASEKSSKSAPLPRPHPPHPLPGQVRNGCAPLTPAHVGTHGDQISTST